MKDKKKLRTEEDKPTQFKIEDDQKKIQNQLKLKSNQIQINSNWRWLRSG